MDTEIVLNPDDGRTPVRALRRSKGGVRLCSGPIGINLNTDEFARLVEFVNAQQRDDGASVVWSATTPAKARLLRYGPQSQEESSTR